MTPIERTGTTGDMGDERSDRELASAIVDFGDERAFRVLYKRHTPVMYRFVLGSRRCRSGCRGSP